MSYVQTSPEQPASDHCDRSFFNIRSLLQSLIYADAEYVFMSVFFLIVNERGIFQNSFFILHGKYEVFFPLRCVYYQQFHVYSNLDLIVYLFNDFWYFCSFWSSNTWLIFKACTTAFKLWTHQCTVGNEGAISCKTLNFFVRIFVTDNPPTTNNFITVLYSNFSV